nr:NADH dehydrogenase subunit 2 [Travisia sanrikuensis]
MLLRLFSPWNFFFSFILFGSILSGSLSPHGLTLWLTMEINMYTFIPLMLSSTASTNRKEAAMKYLLAQAVGSIILLMSLIDLQVNFFPSLLSSSMLVTSGLLKMGTAPLHHWFPSVMGSLSWPMCTLLLTIQKILPLTLIFWTLQPNSFPLLSLIFFSASMSTIIGGWGGMNQSMLRPLLAYSSIGHMGWMLASATISKSLMWIYFFIYLINVIPLVTTLSFTIKTSSTELKTLLLLSFKQRTIISLLFFSLGGLPPLLGFFPKLLLFSFLASSAPFLTLFLIMGSLMNLYYYFKFTFIILQNKPNIQNNLTPSNLKSMILSLLSMVTLFFFILPWLLI